MQNHGQSDQQGRPLRQRGGFNLFYTPGEVVLTLGEPDAVRAAVGEQVTASLHIEFVGANSRPAVAGLEEVPGRFSNLVGSDPTVPHTGIARYRKVRYSDVYPGIDLTYYAGQRRLHSELAIKPGADPAAIRLAFRGTDRPRLDKEGNLILSLADREVVQATVAYQVIGGKRREISIHLELNEQQQVVGEVGDYNRRQTLTMRTVFDYGRWAPFPFQCDLGGADGYFIAVQGPPIPLGPTVELPGPYGWIEYPVNLVYVSALVEGLDNCPVLRDSIVWETGDGKLIPFQQWSPDHKQVLYDYYDQLLSYGEKTPLYIPCPDPQKNLHATSYHLHLTAHEAFNIYVAHVAWALYLEAKKLVPWSLAAQSKGGREEILASYRHHARIKPSQSVDFYPPHIKPDRDFQPVLQDQGYGILRCDPRIGYGFVKGQSPQHAFHTENLLGASEEETLAKLTAWVRRNVGHGGGFQGREDMLKRGVFLENRLKAQLANYDNANRWLIDSVIGCHTASALLYDLAKSVNIPLRHVSTLEDRHAGEGHFRNVTHGGLVYRWDGPNARVLYHTDNLYADDDSRPIFPIDGQNNPISADEAAKRFFEAYWVSPDEIKSWGFDYKLELVDPQLVNQQFHAATSGPWESFYDFGYTAGYWLRSDRTTQAYGEDEHVLNADWRNDLQKLFRLERKHQLCSWVLVMYYAQNGEDGKGLLEVWLTEYEAKKKTGLPPLHSYGEYWEHTKACVNAYGGGQAVVDLAKSWGENRGYPK